MKNALTVVFCTNLLCVSAQERFVSIDYSQYYEWFHQQSQVEELYADASTLYVFSEKTKVLSGPCATAEVIAELTIGEPVTNIAYDEYFVPEDQINGYGDIWYHVKVPGTTNRETKGYIWGGDIAKGWRKADLTGDGLDEFILLGISSVSRVKPKDIFAELRIVQNGKLFSQKNLPGLCVFEDCASSPLLRVFAANGLGGKLIVEASTITIGCDAGIERAFFYWDGRTLQRVFHAEYTTKKLYAKKSFEVADDRNSPSYRICHYSHQDNNFEPVWKCETVNEEAGTTKPIATQDKEVAKAR